MGMFDYIAVADEIKLPYPNREKLNEFLKRTGNFQTKSFHNCMKTYFINENGRLIGQNTHYEKVPEEDRYYYGKQEWNSDDKQVKALARFAGSLKLIVDSEYDLNYHGVFNFYTVMVNEWIEFEVKFTNGNLTDIKKVNEDRFK